MNWSCLEESNHVEPFDYNGVLQAKVNAFPLALLGTMCGSCNRKVKKSWMHCCHPRWIGRFEENYEPDPKGFLGYRSTCQLGRFCLSGRRSAGKTFRVSDDEGQCVETLRVSSVIGCHVRQGSLAYHDEGQSSKPLGSLMMVIGRLREKSPREAERNCNKIGR